MVKTKVSNLLEQLAIKYGDRAPKFMSFLHKFAVVVLAILNFQHAYSIVGFLVRIGGDRCSGASERVLMCAERWGSSHFAY